MSPRDILSTLEREGVVLEPRLAAQGTFTDEHRRLIRNHKPDLLRELTGGAGVPRLPWQLERLVRAASSSQLQATLKGVHDPARYTLAWAAAYLTGDREEALRRLWQVYEAWQAEPVN